MADGTKFMTLERFINEGEELHPGATGEFSSILHDLSLAAKLVWREVSKAGLVNGKQMFCNLHESGSPPGGKRKTG